MLNRIGVLLNIFCFNILNHHITDLNGRDIGYNFARSFEGNYEKF